MIRHLIAFTLTILLSFSDNKDIFPPTALDSFEKIQKTLIHIFSEEQLAIYEEHEDLLLGVVEDFDSERFLLVRALGWIGEMEILINGKLIENPIELISQKNIKTYGLIVDATDASSRIDHSKVIEDNLGTWFKLSKKDTLKFKANLTYPHKLELTLCYSPKDGWNREIRREEGK